MTSRYRKQSPLADILRSQQEEIKKYKWIESEKMGRDIGWDQAEQEWLRNHFPGWKRDRWKHAVQDALRTEEQLRALGLDLN